MSSLRCRGIAVLAGVVTTLPLTTACEEVEPVTVAVVVGDHTGAAPLLDGTGRVVPVISEALEAVLERPGTLTVIANDGQPRVVETVPLRYDDSSSIRQDDTLRANRRRVENSLAGAGPKVAQADPIAALKLAGDAVRGRPNPQVLVADNGLSTTGAVLMQTGLITSNTDVVALAKQSKGQLLGPLTGVHIRWVGLCSVAAPQPPCTAAIQTQLQGYYRRLVADVGGTVTFDDAPLSGGAVRDSRPPVDVVPWTTPTVTPPDDPASSRPDEPPAPPVVEVLDEDHIKFLPNSDRYADPARAETVIADLATRLKAGRYRKVEVVGCTAKVSTASDQDMIRRGRSRSRIIVADLRAHGVTTPLVARSLGWRCPGYQPNRDDANRRVIVSSVPITTGGTR